jgi:hypothetical protein
MIGLLLFFLWWDIGHFALAFHAVTLFSPVYIRFEGIKDIGSWWFERRKPGGGRNEEVFFFYTSLLRLMYIFFMIAIQCLTCLVLLICVCALLCYSSLLDSRRPKATAPQHIVTAYRQTESSSFLFSPQYTKDARLTAQKGRILLSNSSGFVI